MLLKTYLLQLLAIFDIVLLRQMPIISYLHWKCHIYCIIIFSDLCIRSCRTICRIRDAVGPANVSSSDNIHKFAATVVTDRLRVSPRWISRRQPGGEPLS
jgi:hypothetical protein